MEIVINSRTRTQAHADARRDTQTQTHTHTHARRRTQRHRQTRTRTVLPGMLCSATQGKCLFKFCLLKSFWIHNILCFFHLVRTQIHQVFRSVSRPHRPTAVHVRSMNFPNLVHILVAINKGGKGGWSCRH